MRWWLALILSCVMALPVLAQDDKDRITRYLQDALSGAGRIVQIDGFRGALSARATIDRLTIADDQGVWLTLTDAVLDWNRSAVLGGRIEINELSAGEILLPRLPAAQGGGASPEAHEFALPDLPVSVRIDRIQAARVVLGAPVIGVATTLSVAGAVTLDGGDGTARLQITRTSGPRGSFTLDAGYSGTSRILRVDLALDEAAEGIAATLLRLPGAPALSLTVRGEDPVDDFAADIVLRSDGQDRLTGRVATRTEADPEARRGQDATVRLVDARIEGDLTELFAPQYRPFFGPEVALASLVRLYPDGRVTLDDMTVSSAALDVDGRLALAADRLPDTFRLNIRLADPAQIPVLLPLAGPRTLVTRADLTAIYDRQAGETWSLQGSLEGLERPGLRLEAVQLSGDGAIRHDGTRQVSGRVQAATRGLQLADGALAQAIGPVVTLGADLLWRDGAPLDITDLALDARGLRLTGAAQIDGLDSALTVAGRLRAEVADLSRLSLLAGRPLTGSLAADLAGNAAALSGAFDLELSGVATDLAVGIPKVDAALRGDSRLQISALRDAGGLTLRSARVVAAGTDASASGKLATGASDLQFRASLGDIGAFVDGLNGPVTLSGRAQAKGTGWLVDLDGAAPFDTILTAQINALSGGEIRGKIDTTIGSAGLIAPDIADAGTVHLTASGTLQPGAVRQARARLDVSARGLRLLDKALAAAIGPEVTVGADLQWAEGQTLDLTGLTLDARGVALAGDTRIALDGKAAASGILHAEIADLARLSLLAGRSLSGAMTADLTARHAALDGSAFDVDLAAVGSDLGIGIAKLDALLRGETRLDAKVRRNAEGIALRTAELVTRDSNLRASGVLAPGKSDLQFQALLGDLGALVAGVDGPASVTGRARENGAGWIVDLDGKGPFATIARARITAPKGGEPDAELEATIGNVGAIVPDLAGSGTLTATARSAGALWALDARAQGPGGSQVTATGRIAKSFGSADLDLSGALPLALLNRRLAPRSMTGLANFDLALNGPLALASLSGQARTRDARLSLPFLRNALEQIDATVDLAGNAARITATAALDSGGRLAAQGRVGLQAPNLTDITLQVSNATIRDPQLYETNANGTLTITGAAPSDLRVAGQIVLDRTEIRIPSTGLGAAGPIPQIDHLAEPAAVRRTRGFAGLLDDGTNGAQTGSGVALDVRLLAENRIFVRGRGLDAELGGQLRLTGTTADIIPIGQFDLIRGRLDILGKRMNLEEGSARLEGSLIPTLRLVARTTVDDTALRVTIEGPANAPEITFSSEPDLPGDEVLARLLFGRDIGSLSALQAVQLASAIAVLAGRGGGGVIERLREGTGLDDLDVTSDAAGATSVRAGKYISENVYTDIVVDSHGKSQINLNLDLTPSTQLRGTLGSDGRTGVGVFFEKDY